MSVSFNNAIFYSEIIAFVFTSFLNYFVVRSKTVFLKSLYDEVFIELSLTVRPTVKVSATFNSPVYKRFISRERNWKYPISPLSSLRASNTVKSSRLIVLDVSNDK